MLPFEGLVFRALACRIGGSVSGKGVFQAPRSWAEKVYPHVTYFHEAAKGGHFAAWEEPRLFAEELRAAFRSLC